LADLANGIDYRAIRPDRGFEKLDAPVEPLGTQMQAELRPPLENAWAPTDARRGDR